MESHPLSLTLKRCKTPIGKALNFFVDSKTLEINSRLIFEEHQVLGDNAPYLSFSAGDVNHIKIKSIFHDDLGDDFMPIKVDEFLAAYSHVYSEDRSVSEIILKAGPVEIECFLTRYQYTPMIFGSAYRVMGLELELDLISAKEPKNALTLPLKKGPKVASFAASDAVLDFGLGGLSRALG
jgi:hypothetical protein